MTSDRTQRRIERLLDEAEQAMDRGDWAVVEVHALQVLRLDPENADARSFLSAAQREPAAGADGEEQRGDGSSDQPAARPSAGAGGSPALLAGATAASDQPAARPADATPTSFDDSRYTVKKFLGEGGKKKVYLAHDTMLDRDVAFALIKTEGLDGVGRERVSREAQAMGRLGSHPHIVTVFDLGEEPILPLPSGSSLPTSLFCSMSGGARGVSGTAREEV